MSKAQLAANAVGVIGLIFVLAGLFDQAPSLLLDLGVWLLGGAAAVDGWLLIAKHRRPPA